MMTDEEAFALLGEVMAEVVDQLYSLDEIMMMPDVQAMSYRLMNLPTWRGYEWYSSLTHPIYNATYAP